MIGGQTSSGLTRRVRKFLQETFSKSDSANTGEKLSIVSPKVKLYSYSDITLKLFLEITDSKNYSLLIIDGSPTPDQLWEAWETLVKTNDQATGSLHLSNYIRLVKSYAHLFRKYNTVKACLLKLLCTVDIPTVTYLSTFGYVVVTNRGNEVYAKSIDDCLRSSNNLLTKIETKRKLMDSYTKDQDTPTTLGKMIAVVNNALKYRAIDSDVLLSEYNEHTRLIKLQNPKTDGK